jgi:DNA-binding protein YbaB
MKQLIIFSLVIVGLVGCQPSTESVEQDVQTLMQTTYDTDATLKKYHLVASKVVVVHAEGNKYSGVATVTMDGKEHSVSLTVVDDGKNLIYESDKDAFGFLFERAYTEALSESP